MNFKRDKGNCINPDAPALKKSFSKMKPNTFKHWNITLKILIESFGIERKLMERNYFNFIMEKK